MKSILSHGIYVCAFSVACTFPVLAHNGARAVAYPIESITVDGDSADWPETLERYAIDMSAPDEESDFKGSFRVGYNLEEQALYVLVEIQDDEHRRADGVDQTFLSQDAHLLYLDDVHDPRGSGVSTYELTENSLRKILHSGSWDPTTRLNGLDDVSAAANRHENTMTYEWRLHLGEHLKTNTTLGLDHEVIDVDSAGASRVSWGLFQYKSSLSNNLGDVFIAESDGTAFGILEGVAELAAPYQETVPYGLEITSKNNPALWTQLPLLRSRAYSIELPPGEYRVKSALIGNVTSEDVYLSSAGDRGISVTVEPGVTTTAETFRVQAKGEPALVPTQAGMLRRDGRLPSAEIDRFFEDIMHFYAIPGLNLALIKEGKVVYEKSYGLANGYTKHAINDDAIYDAGSLTKPVFAFLVMKLAEEGIIDLDRPLHEYYRYDDIVHDVAHHQITARHVLTHRTGFPNWRRGQLNFVNSPGTFGYSGEGFVYLSKVVEAVTGENTETLLRRYVTDVIDMPSTYFSANADLQARLVYGHNDKYSTSLRPARLPNMAYSMHTNATDFTAFMLTLHNREVLLESTFDEILSDQVDIPVNWSEANTDWRQAFGLGLQLKHSPYGLAFGHSGRNGGYDCTFEMYTEEGFGYVFFTNSSNGFRLKNIVREFLVSGRNP